MKIKFFLHSPNLVLHPCDQQFLTYSAAVLFGQEHAGFGHFLIDTGAYVPTREEQLLLPPLPGRTRQKRKTSQAGRKKEPLALAD